MDHPAVETLARALAALDADACVRTVEEVGRAVGPDRLLVEIYLPALSRVGDIWARGLLDDLAFAQAAVIAEQLWGVISPGPVRGETSTGPVVLIGVVAPDRHDIGKNQVVRLLTEAGARVTDIGAEVEPSEFAAKAAEIGAAFVLVGASTHDALSRVADVIEVLADAGSTALVLVGGQAALFAQPIDGVEAFVADGYEAVDAVMGAPAAGPGGPAPAPTGPGGSGG